MLAEDLEATGDEPLPRGGHRHGYPVEPPRNVGDIRATREVDDCPAGGKHLEADASRERKADRLRQLALPAADIGTSRQMSKIRTSKRQQFRLIARSARRPACAFSGLLGDAARQPTVAGFGSAKAPIVLEDVAE